MNLFNASIASFAQTRSAGHGGVPLFSALFGGGATTTSGKKINHDTSLKVSAFWCGVNAIANSVALLPKRVVNKTDKTRKTLTDHPVDYVIHREPNQCMTAYTFWFTITVCAIIKGNAYARIIRDAFGKIQELQLLENHDVIVYKQDGKLWYKIQGNKTMLHADEILHIPGFAWNGIAGVGVIRYAADNLGIALNADQYGAQSFEDRGVSYGILETDKDLNDKGKKNIAKIFGQSLAGTDKHRLAVFDEGMKYKRIALSPAETQFIETKAMGAQDVARWLNIPAFKLHIDGEGGYNYLVQMSIEYLQSAVQPWAQRIKEEADRKLLTKKEIITGNGIHINYRKLLEVDPKARGEYYKMMYMIGAYNADEIRDKEDESPRADGKGDEYFHMANMLSVRQLEKELENE